MALLLRTATLDGRPSSSSGPGSGDVSARRADLDKRRSRDDLLIGTETAEKQRYKSFHIPLRNRQPMPRAIAPNTFIPASHASINSVGSIGASATGSDVGVIAIGMALGSPSHAPAGTGWQQQHQDYGFEALKAPISAVPGRTHQMLQEEPREASPQKPKSRMWGLFRSKSRSKLAKKAATSEPASASSKTEATMSPIASPPSQVTAEMQKTTPKVARSGSLAAQSNPRHKPLVVRSNTAPVTGGEDVEPKLSQQPPRAVPLSAPVPAASASLKQGSRPAPPGTFHLPTARSPVLDVEIPNITMERYSIMFGQVLQDKAGGRAPPSRSSLLARRQATLNKLKTIEDEPDETEDTLQALPRPRRITSPQHQKSPSFHLFPPAPRRTPNSPAHSPRLRSNTSPAGLPSPGIQTFDHGSPLAQAARSRTFPSPAGTPGSASTERLPNSDSPTQRRPSLKSKFQRPSPSSNMITPTAFESPTSITESPSSTQTTKPAYHPTAGEPIWEMISPPASTTASASGTSKNSSLSSVESAEQLTVIKSPVDAKQAQSDKALREAVQASIIRQISVSRDQRQMLGTISETRSNNPTTRGRKGSLPVEIGDMTMGKNERLVESKKLTPTLVLPDAEPDDTTKTLHRHRKSERVILEGM